jgi:hypothetical protein
MILACHNLASRKPGESSIDAAMPDCALSPRRPIAHGWEWDESTLCRIESKYRAKSGRFTGQSTNRFVIFPLLISTVLPHAG